MSENPTRRRVLQTAGAVGGVAVAAAGCGFVGAGTRTAAVPTGPLTLGPASAVPVGGGTVYSTEQVVVTQPSEGVFHGFSAICTHQGCLVTRSPTARSTARATAARSPSPTARC